MLKGDLKQKTERRYILAEQTGFIAVNVTTATGSYPVAGADVIISRITGEGDTVLYRYVTDESGQTPLTSLPAPELSNSLSVASSGPDYTLYNVTVTSNGFYPLVSLNIPVFTGIVSRQPMVLIPLTVSSEIGTDEYVPECQNYNGGCGPVSDKGVRNE